MIDYQILALDLDGTLTNSQKHASHTGGVNPDSGSRN